MEIVPSTPSLRCAVREAAARRESLDLTRFSYLGLLHAHSELPGWARLSSGLPAATEREDDLGVSLAPRLASLLGTEAAAISRSTLHVFRDLFDALSREPIAIFMDDASYLIARWGVAWAQAAGVPVSTFPHHDGVALEALLAQGSADRRPVVVVDGVSARRWSMAPLPEYAACLSKREGLLIVDDTHAVGVFGRGRTPTNAFGRGGGGSLAWHGMPCSNIILVSSLAKGLGVPVAVLSASAERVAWFLDNSLTRTHCSAPTTPELLALERALDVNAERGDELRGALQRNVLLWRGIFHEAGFASDDSIYPVQVLRLPRSIERERLDEAARSRGVRIWVEGGPGGATVLVVLTAALSEAEVDFAARALLAALEEVASQSCWGCEGSLLDCSAV